MSVKEKYVLKVRNPRSVRKIDDFQGLTAPRLDSLEGKRVAVLVMKPDGALYIDPLEEYLKKKYPTATFARYEGARSPAAAASKSRSAGNRSFWSATFSSCRPW